MSTSAHAFDEAKPDRFMGRFGGDLGAAISAALVVIGDKLGLYRAMSDSDRVSAEELASRPGTDARHVREWLSNQAAGGYGSSPPRGPRTRKRSHARSRAAAESAGTSTTTTCSLAPSGFSAPGTPPTWS